MKSRVYGHFGEWLQGRMGPSGPVGLVTVPCSALWIEARLVPDTTLSLKQYADILTPQNAKQFLTDVGGATGAFELTGNIPPGGGCGASTAALVALAKAANGDESALLSACLHAEGASDPLMLPSPDSVVWASREGRVLENLAPLPSAEIVGGFWGDPIRTNHSDTVFPDISDLAAQMTSVQHLEDLAAIASVSATRCTALRGPHEDPTADLAAKLNALGHLRAHTGSARGMIFHPGTAPKSAETFLSDAGYDRVFRFETGSPA